MLWGEKFRPFPCKISPYNRQYYQRKKDNIATPPRRLSFRPFHAATVARRRAGKQARRRPFRFRPLLRRALSALFSFPFLRSLFSPFPFPFFVLSFFFFLCEKLLFSFWGTFSFFAPPPFSAVLLRQFFGGFFAHFRPLSDNRPKRPKKIFYPFGVTLATAKKSKNFR